MSKHAQGPDFSRVGIVSEEGVASSKERIYATLENVMAEMDALGIPEPVRPSTHPASLADLDTTLLTNTEMSALYTQYVAYSSYIGDELAKIEGLEESAKKLLRETLGEIKDSLFAKGMKGAEVTAAATRDPLYRDLDMEHARLFFMKAIMKRRYRGYTGQAAALSRSIELRKLDFEQHRRDANTGYGRPKTPRGFGSKK